MTQIDQETQTKIESAVTTTVDMLTLMKGVLPKNTAPSEEFIKQQAIHVMAELGLETQYLPSVMLGIEQRHDIGMPTLIVVPEQAEGEPSPIWQPVTYPPLVKRYLELLEQEGWSPESRTRLANTTRDILSRCGNPAVQGLWNKRGMVVGDVQSGKTTSYVSLICAAISAGYRNIVVLGGRTNDLRHQTQERIDLGVTGIESSRVNTAQTRIGVGLLYDIPKLTILSLTSQDHVGGKGKKGGDFGKGKASHNNLTGDAVCIAVIKKHASMIDNIRTWLSDNGKTANEPLLLIDDEADDASIDTNDPDETPTAINAAIRSLLHTVGRSTYIAYTATPYANVMIDPEGHGDEHGDDLFPKDFIALLTPPTTYFGARRFLKEYGTHSRTVTVKDADAWIDKGQVQGPMPESLKEAIREFILVSAVRRVRRRRQEKERQHETMLVHASIRTNAHSKIEKQIQDEVDRLQAGWDFPVGDQEVRKEVKKTWEVIEKRQDKNLYVGWDEIKDEVSAVFENLKITSINGTTKAALDYRRARTGPLTVIAVGGAKLSRGLTLEGLTTSYHLRYSVQHDTLMQMCRWFGYRQEYEDLCRLHSQADLLDAFRDVMESDEELRVSLEEMAELSATPLDFGIRIRTYPGMSITAKNKLRHGEITRYDIEGKTLEVTRVALKDTTHNDQVMQALVSKLDSAGTPRPGVSGVWDDVPWDVIADALDQFRELPIVKGKGKLDRARRYIQEAQHLKPPRLKTWTVALARNQKGSAEIYGGQEVHRVERTWRFKDEKDALHYGVVTNPSDEKLAKGASEGQKRTDIKHGRTSDEGLLLIYPIRTPHEDYPKGIETTMVGISLPGDKAMANKTYVANPIAQKEELDA